MDTQRTDCSDTFIRDVTREDYAANVQNSSPEAASIVQANARAIFDMKLEDNGGTTGEMAAETAGPAVLNGPPLYMSTNSFSTPQIASVSKNFLSTRPAYRQPGTTTNHE